MRNNGIRCAEYFMYRSIGIGFCFSFAFFSHAIVDNAMFPLLFLPSFHFGRYLAVVVFIVALSLGSTFFACVLLLWARACICHCHQVSSHRIVQINKQQKKKRIHGVYIMCRGCDYSVVWLLPFDERKHNPQPNVDVDFRLIPFLLFFFSSLHHFLRTLSFHSSFFFFSTFSTVFLSSMLPFHPFVFLLLLLLSLCFHPYQTMHKQCGMRSIRFK